jgi:hypothetical protein
MKPKFYWHIHHTALCEIATEPIQNRIQYIREYKDPCEVPTRLRLLKPVKAELPARLVRAAKTFCKWVTVVEKMNVAYRKAERAFERASDENYPRLHIACEKAGRASDKVRGNCDIAEERLRIVMNNFQAQLEALHKIECPDCPWDGKTTRHN